MSGTVDFMPLLPACWHSSAKKKSTEIKCGRMGRYDYHIGTKKINPPIGKRLGLAALGKWLGLAGYVQFMFLQSDEGNVKVEHDFGEAWGRTEEEARDKMKAKNRGMDQNSRVVLTTSSIITFFSTPEPTWRKCLKVHLSPDSPYQGGNDLQK